MAEIRRGEQYAIPFTLHLKGNLVTPENVTDVRIQVDDELREYSKSELVYDSEQSAWLFPLTEEKSRAFVNNYFEYQVAVKKDGEIFMSNTVTVNVARSIIETGWTE